MMFLGLRKLGNICCGHKMFPTEQNQKHFVSRTQMLHVWANGETFVSATMCPQQCVLVCQGLEGTFFWGGVRNPITFTQCSTPKITDTINLLGIFIFYFNCILGG